MFIVVIFGMMLWMSLEYIKRENQKIKRQKQAEFVLPRYDVFDSWIVSFRVDRVGLLAPVLRTGFTV